MKTKLSSKSFLFKNQSGQMLVQTLVAVAIMGVVMAAMATMMRAQFRETAALSQKMAAAELERFAISALADGSVCTKLLNNKTFDANLIGGQSPPVFDLGSTLPASSAVGAPAVATVGQPASPVSALPTVQRIQVRDLAGPPLGNVFTANVDIDLNPAGLIRQLRPVTVQTTIVTTGVGPAKTISSCVGTGTTGPGRITGGAWCNPAFFGTACLTWNYWGSASGGGCPADTDPVITGEVLGGPTGILCVTK